MSELLESRLTTSQRREADAADAMAVIDAHRPKPPRFAQTYCSQCGRKQGPGDSGHSSCSTHCNAVALEQKSKDLREAVQALQDRARDAFDCGRNLDQEALEAAWADEEPAHYAQFQRLWFGAQL